MNETIVRLNARIANQRQQINHLHFVVAQLKKKATNMEPSELREQIVDVIRGAVLESDDCSESSHQLAAEVAADRILSIPRIAEALRLTVIKGMGE